MIFAWGVFANIGLVFGPIYSTYVTQNLGWRWVFWIAAIVTFCQAILTLFIRESRPSQILKGRLCRLNRATKRRTQKPFRIDNPDQSHSLHEFITIALTSPTRLFFREPIVFLVTLMIAIAFAQIYLFTEALPDIYEQAPLNFDTEHASLSFLPILIGLLLDIFPRFYDDRLLNRIKASGQVIKPEHKIRAFAIGAPALASDSGGSPGRSHLPLTHHGSYLWQR
jgi:MFS family permease